MRDPDAIKEDKINIILDAIEDIGGMKQSTVHALLVAIVFDHVLIEGSKNQTELRRGIASATNQSQKTIEKQLSVLRKVQKDRSHFMLGEVAVPVDQVPRGRKDGTR